eukprot:TRINITY_DN3458_c0_g1_i1.p1 TRINITY_DN3458_c0_g1~~TRINITY_DN3458_c0_g1_i1.p1  ORF type:complete len:372 (+),score=73.41 TRINITY_DN3458_c0_g1_i1:73-1188(+)
MSEEFSRELLRVVVAQICKNVGFTGATLTSYETLVDVLQKYLEEIGSRSHNFAELAGRIETNFHDLCQTFSEMDVDLADLSSYANETEETPFPKPLPEFPIKRQNTHKPELKDPIEPLPPHIPDFLPPFPDKHTYNSTPVYEHRIEDPLEVSKIRNKRKRQVEDALIRLSSDMQDLPVSSYDYSTTSSSSTFAYDSESPNIYLHPPTTSSLPTESDMFLESNIMEDSYENDAESVGLEYDNKYVIQAYQQKRKEENKHSDGSKGKSHGSDKKNNQKSKEIDTTDKARKRQKVEKIIELKHEKGMEALEPEPITTGGGGSKKKDNKKDQTNGGGLMSPPVNTPGSGAPSPSVPHVPVRVLSSRTKAPNMSFV